MRIRNRALLCVGVFALLLVYVPAACAAGASATVEKNTVWEGKVAVEGTVTVRKGVTLTLNPGTVVSFAKGGGLICEGVLIAKGSKDAPIRFLSAGKQSSPGEWEGVRFTEGSTGSILSRCVILGAAAVEIYGTGIEIGNCEIGKGKIGVVVGPGSNPKVVGNTIGEMSGGGVRCASGSTPWIEKNVLRSCGPFGISGDRSAAPLVRENEISGCERGIAFYGTIPPVEGNVFRKNEVGVSATMTGNRQILRGNRFEGNRIGLLCEQFSEPLVERNLFSGNGEALVCLRSSNPLVRNNGIVGNDNGIVAGNLSCPMILANEIRGNKKGIYLTYSSYATIRGNNIYENEIQVELGLMSSDWERKTRNKPLRGGAAQRTYQASRGIPTSRQGEEEKEPIKRSVDATGNWWGEKDTEEMERKGPEANIGGLIDYYDAPAHPSDGYPGVYEQDRIRYEGWRKSRLPDAGVPKGSGS